jgi:ribose transport system substrate-binding protein
MKRIALTAAALALGLGAAQAQPKKDVTIAVSIPAATHGWTGGVVYHAQETAKQLEKGYPGLKVIVKTSPTAPPRRARWRISPPRRSTRSWCCPSTRTSSPTRCARSRRRAPFITVGDRGLKDPRSRTSTSPATTRVRPRGGKYFVDNLKQGNVVVFRGIPTVIDEERVTNFEKALEGSGVKVIDKQYANWNRDDAFKVMQDFLAKHPKIDAVWASDDDMALGVMEAIRQAKREDIKFVLGGAGMKDIVKRVMDGDKMIPANVSYPPSMISTAMGVTAANYFSNARCAAPTCSTPELITKDNAKNHYFPNSPF